MTQCSMEQVLSGACETTFKLLISTTLISSSSLETQKQIVGKTKLKASKRKMDNSYFF